MTNKYEIAREFIHAQHGNLGTAKLALTDKGELVLNGTALNGPATEYLLNYSLRALQDAYAGAKNADEAKAFYGKRLDAIASGTINQRVATGVTFEQRQARIVMRDTLKALGKFDKDKHDADALDALFAKNAATMQPILDKRLAQIKREAELKANADIKL